MPTKPRSTRPRRPGERMRAAGLRPVQYWVPDLRNPSIRAAIRKEAAQLNQHPENDAIDERLDAVLSDNE